MDLVTKHRIAREGLEPLGSIRLGGVVVIGDPLVIGRNPSNGAYHAARTAGGSWEVFGRPDEADPDRLVEVVLVATPVAARFWELYDDAVVTAVLAPQAKRIAVVDGPRKDDLSLCQAMYEPDLDALPWLVDDALVLAGDPAHEVVLRGAGEPAVLLSIAFGPVPIVPAAAPMTEE
jgi:hypothetical protein